MSAGADLAIVVVSTEEGHWLERCLQSVLEHQGSARIETIVVDNESSDDTRAIVQSRFPETRLISSPNRGFAHGNNRGLELACARYLLLLNPDTEVLSGTFGELIELLDARPGAGVIGVRQVNSAGELAPTMHRFPNALRALGEAFAVERWPVHPAWAGERVLDPRAYEIERECDWPLGSFMLIRREALLAAGLLDERFFIYSEEPDLCLRIKRCGWTVGYLPSMTIVHHSHPWGERPVMLSQDAYARKQYAGKHFGPVHRRAYLWACALRHLIRAAAGRSRTRREGARRSLRVLIGASGPPFGAPPDTAITAAQRGDPARRCAGATKKCKF